MPRPRCIRRPQAAPLRAAAARSVATSLKPRRDRLATLSPRLYGSTVSGALRIPSRKPVSGEGQAKMQLRARIGWRGSWGAVPGVARLDLAEAVAGLCVAGAVLWGAFGAWGWYEDAVRPRLRPEAQLTPPARTPCGRMTPRRCAVCSARRISWGRPAPSCAAGRYEWARATLGRVPGARSGEPRGAGHASLSWLSFDPPATVSAALSRRRSSLPYTAIQTDLVGGAGGRLAGADPPRWSGPRRSHRNTA